VEKITVKCGEIYDLGGENYGQMWRDLRKIGGENYG